MNFEFDEDVALLRKSVEEFCRQAIAPRAAQWDEACALPPELPAELGQLGLLAMRVPEAAGGAGLSMVAATALVEALAVADASVALTVAAHNFLFVGHLMRRGQAPPDGLGAWAQAGDSASVSASASGWSLSGGVAQVVAGATAKHRVVVTHDGAYAVEQGPSGAATGVPTVGLRAAGVADLRFDAAPVTPLGGDAAVDISDVLDDHRIGIAAIACGLMRAALDAARGYALERQQFGKPIASFQAIQFKLANLATDLDAARLMTFRAAWHRDRDQPIHEAAARAKLFATTRATAGISEALQVHGGFGYTREFPVERYLRDARMLRLCFGTDEDHRKVIGARLAQSST